VLPLQEAPPVEVNKVEDFRFHWAGKIHWPDKKKSKIWSNSLNVWERNVNISTPALPVYFAPYNCSVSGPFAVLSVTASIC